MVSNPAGMCQFGEAGTVGFPVPGAAGFMVDSWVFLAKFSTPVEKIVENQGVVMPLSQKHDRAILVNY